MNKHGIELRVVTGVAAIIASSAASGAVFNLSDNFSTTRNPNGVWSYNLGGIPIASPITGAAVGADYLVGWGYRSDLDASITKAIAAPSTLWHDFQVGDVAIHSDSRGVGDVSIAWISPGAGTIDITGAAWDAYFYWGRDASWSLIVDGTEVAQHSSVSGVLRTDTVASFANNIVAGQQLNGLAVRAGDVVEFLTHTKPGNYGHFMGVDMTINFTPIPEPVACAVAGLGLLAFVTGRRFLRER